MDRRSFIGLALISVIIFLVLLWSGNNQKKNAPAKARYEQKFRYDMHSRTPILQRQPGRTPSQRCFQP